MKNKKINLLKKHCFLCYNFTLGEFDEKDIKNCAENWLDAENCPNWIPLGVFIAKGKKFKKIEVVVER